MGWREEAAKNAILDGKEAVRRTQELADIERVRKNRQENSYSKLQSFFEKIIEENLGFPKEIQLKEEDAGRYKTLTYSSPIGKNCASIMFRFIEGKPSIEIYSAMSDDLTILFDVSISQKLYARKADSKMYAIDESSIDTIFENIYRNRDLAHGLKYLK